MDCYYLFFLLANNTILSCIGTGQLVCSISSERLGLLLRYCSVRENFSPYPETATAGGGAEPRRPEQYQSALHCPRSRARIWHYCRVPAPPSAPCQATCPPCSEMIWLSQNSNRNIFSQSLLLPFNLNYVFRTVRGACLPKF